MSRRLDGVDGMMMGLVLVWGTAFAAIQVLGEVLDPFQMTWFRYAPFPVLYGLYLAAARRAVFATVSGGDWVRMALLGAVGVLGYHFPLNWGMHDTSSGTQVSAAVAAILVATVPLFTLLVAVVTKAERLRPAALLGSVVAFIGVGIVILYGSGAVEIAFAKRTLVIVLAPAAWAVYSVFTKPLIHKYGGLFVTGVTLSLGVFTLLPLAFSYGTQPLADFEARHWRWLLFLAFLSTAGGYAVWNQALKRRKASDVAVFVYLQPVVAALVGWWYLDERLSAPFLLGAALILVGVIQVNRVRWKAQDPAAVAAPDAPVTPETGEAPAGATKPKP